MKAVTISKNGGPEVLEIKDIKLDVPNSDEVLIKNESKIDKRNSRRRKNDGVRCESEQPKQPRQSSGSWFVRLLHKARSLVGL